jgi:hypothetical protein
VSSDLSASLLRSRMVLKKNKSVKKIVFCKHRDQSLCDFDVFLNKDSPKYKVNLLNKQYLDAMFPNTDEVKKNV